MMHYYYDLYGFILDFFNYQVIFFSTKHPNVRRILLQVCIFRVKYFLISLNT